MFSNYEYKVIDWKEAEKFVKGCMKLIVQGW